MIVCLDAGHGGKDPGAVYGDIKEKVITLDMAYRVGELLSDMDVIMTRGNDSYVELSARADFANRQGAGLFISLHCNAAANAEANGLEVYTYTSCSAQSRLAAQKIYNALLSVSALRGRGVKSKNLAVLRETRMPAVLVELGFISNPDDRRKLTDFAWQDDAAKAIADGIVEALQ